MQNPGPHERLVEDGEVGITKTQLNAVIQHFGCSYSRTTTHLRSKCHPYDKEPETHQTKARLLRAIDDVLAKEAP